MLKFRIFTFIFFNNITSFAFDLRIPPEDSTYKYYIGFSDLQTSKSLAIEDATKDVMNQIMIENFGVSFNIELSTNESEKNLSYNKERHMVSQKIIMKGIIRKEVKFDNVGSKIQACALFAVSKKDITDEKNRLSTNNRIVAAAHFNEVGSPEFETEVIITSNVPQAKVYIDDEIVGITPLKIHLNQTKSTLHKIKVDKDGYDTLEEKRILFTNRTNRIYAKLNYKPAILRININIPNASIFINQKFYRKSKLEVVRLDPRIEHEIKVTHPHAPTITISGIRIKNGELHTENIMLHVYSEFQNIYTPKEQFEYNPSDIERFIPMLEKLNINQDDDSFTNDEQ